MFKFILKFLGLREIVTVDHASYYVKPKDSICVSQLSDEELDLMHKFSKLDKAVLYDQARRVKESLERVYPELLPGRVMIDDPLLSLPTGKPGQEFNMVTTKWEDPGKIVQRGNGIPIEDPWQTFGSDVKKKSTHKKQPIDKQPKKGKHTPVKKK